MSIKIEGNRLCIETIKLGSLLEVYIDGGAEAWFQDLKTASGSVYVELPGWLFDARRHDLVVKITYRGKQTLRTYEHQSIYVAEVNGMEPDIFGWIYDATRENTPLTLAIDVDNKELMQITASAENIFAPLPTLHCGFGLRNPIPSYDREPHYFRIRVAGTNYAPLGEYLINITPEALVQAGISSYSHLQHNRLINQFVGSFALEAARARHLGNPVKNFPTWWRVSREPCAQAQSSSVNVIIPVYCGLTETLNCINSVLLSTTAVDVHLTVVNDFSPEPRLTKALREHSEVHRYEYIENSSNLGFVETVNMGMKLHPQMDVVLLNADTVVDDHWLDRMRSAAYSSERIASVSAMSNNATICSLPYIGGQEKIPYGMTLREINTFVGQQNSGVSVELPTAHGFCMYIRRECLNEVGYFDAKKFGKGYGEENEFSLRSATRGWKHVVACDVFVYHCGSVSFKEAAEGFIAKNLQIIAGEYPDYEYNVHCFLRDDPILEYRNKLLRSLWKEKEVAVFFSLAIGGGVDSNLQFMAKKLKDEGYTVLVITRSERPNYRYGIREWGTENEMLYNDRIGIPALIADIIVLNPRFIHVHHLIDMDKHVKDFVASSQIPYCVTLHDYFYICPRVTLMNDGDVFCALPPIKGCEACLGRGGAHYAIDSSYASVSLDIEKWRIEWDALLRGAYKLIAPNDAGASYYRSVLPELNITVLPHMGPLPSKIESRSIVPAAKTKVAILGGIGVHKGVVEIINLLRWAEAYHPDIEFKLIGFTDRPGTLETFGNFENLGKYDQKNLAQKIIASGCQVALFMSPWPETYSYTLSEAYIHGLTPVGYGIGAIGDRIRATGVGEVIEPGCLPKTVIEAIKRASSTQIVVSSYSEGAYASIIRDYYDLPELKPLESDLPIRLDFTEGVYDDGWCGESASLFFALPYRIKTVDIGLYIPTDMSSIFVSVFVNDVYCGLHALEVDALTHAVVNVAPVDGLVRIKLLFSHTTAAKLPDLRRLSAVYVGCEFTPVRPPVTAVLEEESATLGQGA